MNNNVSPMWHQSHDSGTGNGAPDLNDDFSSFLNFNDMPLSMSSPFDTTGEEPLAMDTEFCLDGNNAHSVTADVNQQIPTVTQAEIMDMQFHEIQKSIEAHQHMMNQQVHHHNHHHQHGGMIPPTPSSIEMHAGLPQATLHNINPHMMMDRFNIYREEPMIFTPLVSPAVTPLETEFSRHIPDFVMPGAFSPLTSPALNAHHHRTHMPNPHMSHNPAPMQTLTDPSQSPMLASGKRGSISSGRRKSTTSRNPARVVRESPSMKPQRKRAAPPTPLFTTTKASNTLAQQAPTYSPLPKTSGGSRRDPSTPAVSQQNTPMQHPLSQEGSSNESVSPEPLPEVLMAPPPRRSLSSRSPTDDGSSTAHKPLNAPVTPASLMRLPKTSLPTEDIPPISMDTSEYLNRDVEAQDATNMNGKQYNEEMPTPTMNRSSSRTPSLTPSLKPSRGTSRHTSPLDPLNPGAITKKEPARNGRKRGSVSSSPALQPKISPSIKPLLPIGMSPDASAFLLASKSNYQNIVEGNHSHLGLQYPEHLSTNLTSKRTSHKIAEQGRRNRINNALAEMAGLLPPINGGSAGTDNGTTGKEQTSKASTVELAIEYIRQLKRELEETKAKLKAAEDKLQSTGAATQDKEQKEGMGNEKEKKPGEISVEMEMNGEGTPAVATTA